ncbi:hypothetical protein FVE85_8473 [Porphyridium purpureum]|uniref:Uncharacterized protein n=1 Tax=Porphyridium purpureum TaxID=35688 RepID=A0A5J4YKJ0_PORPP|nr:hypothetical protein FVE85_8473 [Porphyridium purpureum]|eukprot:POR9806..scf244_11
MAGSRRGDAMLFVAAAPAADKVQVTGQWNEGVCVARDVRMGMETSQSSTTRRAFMQRAAMVALGGLGVVGASGGASSANAAATPVEPSMAERQRELSEHYRGAMDSFERLDDLRTMIDLALVDSLRASMRGPEYGNVRIDCYFLATKSPGVQKDKAMQSFRVLMTNFENLDQQAIKLGRGETSVDAAVMKNELDSLEKNFSSFLALIPKPQSL